MYFGCIISEYITISRALKRRFFPGAAASSGLGLTAG